VVFDVCLAFTDDVLDGTVPALRVGDTLARAATVPGWCGQHATATDPLLLDGRWKPGRDVGPNIYHYPRLAEQEQVVAFPTYSSIETMIPVPLHTDPRRLPHPPPRTPATRTPAWVDLLRLPLPRITK